MRERCLNRAPLLQQHLTPALRSNAGKTDWEKKAAGTLKAELKREGVTYAQLFDKLSEIGVDDKEVNIRNKLARGKFSAAF